MKKTLTNILVLLYLDDHNSSSEKTISRAFKGIEKELKITLKNIRDSIQQLHAEELIESWEDHKKELRWNNTNKGREYFRNSNLVGFISGSDHARRESRSSFSIWDSSMD